MTPFQCITFFACILTVPALWGDAEPASRRFPADAGILDVTKPPYNAVPDGVTDCTAAIQQALTDVAGRGLIYLPDGTYLISDTLRWVKGEKRNILQGQSREGTVIRLKDQAPGFGTLETPKPMIWTGNAPAQRFRNGLRDLTLDIGGGNPGAIGAQFIANNQGGIENVCIRSLGRQGGIALDLGYTDEQGPLLVKHLRIEGFQTGVSMRHAVNSVTFEHLEIIGSDVGVLNGGGQVVNMRKYRYEGPGIALRNERGPGLVTLVDGEFKGTGESANRAAIENHAGLYARNLRSEGYRHTIAQGERTVPPGEVDVYLSVPGHSPGPGEPRGLDLPVEETPDIPWDAPETWANVKDFGPPRPYTLKQELYYRGDSSERLPGPPGGTPVEKVVDDWSQALQRAIDSGAGTVYFPAGDGKEEFYICGPVQLRGKLRRLIGCESTLGRIVQHTSEATLYQDESRPRFILEDGEAPAVVVECFNTWYAAPVFIQASSRSLVLRSLSFYEVETRPGSGDVFLEDVRTQRIRVNQSRLFGRQVNTEGHNDPRTLNDGGQVWVLGLKTENDAALAGVRNGGKSEYLGAFAYANRANKKPKEMFWVEDGEISFTVGEWVTRKGAPFDTLVRIVRDGKETRLGREDVQRRGHGSAVILFSTQTGEE